MKVMLIIAGVLLAIAGFATDPFYVTKLLAASGISAIMAVAMAIEDHE